MTFNQSAGGLADFEGGLSSYLKTGTGNLGSLTINDAIVGSQGDVYFDALNGDSGGVFRNNGAGTMYLGVNGGSGTFLGMILDGSGQALVKLVPALKFFPAPTPTQAARRFWTARWF